MAALAAHERAGELKDVMRRSAGDAVRAVEDLFDPIGHQVPSLVERGSPGLASSVQGCTEAGGR